MPDDPNYTATADSEASSAHTGSKSFAKGIFTPANLVVIALAIIIVIIAIWLRIGLLQFYGFYEPDGFYHYSVIRAAADNGFTILSLFSKNFGVPAVLSISGWPSHQPVTEAKGLYLVTLIPWSILQYFGVSYYSVMRIMPVVFALLDMLGAYLLSRYLSKDKVFGLLVIAFVGFSMGNAARTSATIYRGDTFVTFFLIMALVVFVEVFRQQGKKVALPFFGWEMDIKKFAVAVLAGIALSLANFVWNGSPFADATFLFAFLIVLISAFILRKEQIVNDSKYILISLLVWYILVLTAHALSFIQGQQFVDPTFIPVYLSLLAAWVIIYFMTLNVPNLPILRTTAARLVLTIVVVSVGVGLFILIEPSIVYSIFVGNGFITTPGSFGTTIQELQPPTTEFLNTSFGLNMFTSLPSLVMYLPGYFGNQNAVWVDSAGIIGILLMFAVFVPYFFMQAYDTGGFLSGKARIRLDLNIGLAAVMAYFILTAYLQMHAIRFNSLVSIPIAIICAYTIYWLITLFVGFGVPLKGVFSNPQQSKMFAAGICLIFLAWFFYVVLTSDSVYSQTLSQADSINPYFINALNWLHNNSANNSVVLTLWPDGSVVEGVANRTSVTDSVGSQNGSKADPFAAWILNASSEPQFLTSPINGRPNYLLVRFPWLIETQGIYTEANITENQLLFGYLPLTQFSEGQANSTTKQLVFRNSPNGYPYAVINIATTNYINSSSQNDIYSYIQLSQTQVSAFQYVGFYNQDNGNYTLIPQTRFNSTNGELMLVIISSVPKPGFYLNITGAYIFGPGLANSNMLKFLYFCNPYSCVWNNNQATMQEVYGNFDTKIFKITYTNST